ncbi:MAG: redoxin domain-containing protein [Planctomycetota bacterium]
MRLFWPAAIVLVFSLVPPAQAQLRIGDRAPALDVSFVKGEPHDPAAADGKVYLVEFWATWCPPCRDSIPHLARLANRHAAGGLVVIGVTDEEAEKVRGFPLFDRMTYHVACDRERRSSSVWLKGVEGIPHAFLVNQQGVIVWKGHPLDPGLERALGRVLAGTLDAAAEQERLAKIEELEKVLERAMAELEYEKALAVIDELLKLERRSLQSYRLKLTIAQALGKDDLVKATRGAIGQAFRDDPDVLNDVAWEILTSGELDGEAIALAFSLAQRAVDLLRAREGGSASDLAIVLDTLARAWYAVGRLDKAIEIEREALELAAGEEKATFAQCVSAYEALVKLGESGPKPL